MSPADTLFNSLKKQFAHDLRELVVRQAEKVPNKRLGKEIAQASSEFSAAATARDMASSSVPRWDLVKTGLLGKGIMQQASTAALTATGINPVLSRYLSGVVGHPGVIPNSVMAVSRVVNGRTALPPGVHENVLKGLVRGAYQPIAPRMNAGQLSATGVGASRNTSMPD
jgi:hypothetical protein